MWNWFKKRKLKNPSITFEVTKSLSGDDFVEIIVDWDEKETQDRITEVFSKLIFGIKTEIFQKNVQSVFNDKCMERKIIHVPSVVFQKVLAYNLQMANNAKNAMGQLMFPSEVFGPADGS